MSQPPRRPDDTDREANPLARWSERKASRRRDEAAPKVGSAGGEDRGVEEAPKRDEDMPPIHTLDEKSDVSGFLSPDVSEALRTAALRKFFHSPAFNVVDGLDDYDDDFTSFKALGEIVTADMRHRMEREAEAREGPEIVEGPSAENLEQQAEAGPEDSVDSDAVESDGEAHREAPGDDGESVDTPDDEDVV
jgi:hypothetical protein